EGELLVVPPDLGVADVVLQRPEFLEGAAPGLLIHPLQRAEVLREGLLDPVDQTLGDGLSLLAEALLDEGAGEGEAHGAVGGLDAAPPAGRDLLLAGELLLKIEILLDEILGQGGGRGTEEVPREVGPDLVGIAGLEDLVE